MLGIIKSGFVFSLVTGSLTCDKYKSEIYMKKIAFFDFDNTIYNGYTYQDFIDHASKAILKTNKFQNKTKHILQIASNYNDIVSGIAEVVGEIIKGWSRKKFGEYCRISCNRRKIANWVKPVTDFLKLNNFENIIVTASFEEMIADSLEALQIDKTYCSTFKLAENKYNGKIKLLLNEDKKVNVIRNEISNKDTFSIAFGDSMGDAPMLDAVDLPFLVRSYNLEIENIAKQKNWFLGTDSDAIIKEIQKKIMI